MGASVPRILLVSQPTTGGAARSVHHLAGAGTRAGCSVTVASPPDGQLRTWVEEVGASWAPVPLVRPPRPQDLARVVQVGSLARRADLVHLHSSKAGAVGRLALLPRQSRPACVFTPHGWSWQAGGRLLPLYRSFERLTANLADAIIAVSPEERDHAEPVLGRAMSRVRVIENGVDLSHFTPEGARAPRDQFPLVVCIGRLAYPKGQDVALHALAAMADRSARLRLIGDGPDLLRLRSLALRLGIGERVDFWGAVDDPAVHLRTADVVIVPSWSEGLSLAMLEAMACATAIVATRVPGASALEGAGWVVPPGEPQALARAIDALLVDPAARAALGAQARARAERRFSLARMTDETLALWVELMEPSLSRGPS